MKFHLNLKYNSPLILLAVAFGIFVLLSFKRATPPAVVDLPASNASTNDQILLSSMHAETSSKQSSGMSAPTPMVVSPTDTAQLKIFDEVLASKEDNDPRLDSELKLLSPAAKQLLRNRYMAMPEEKRNGRGTVVFLVGRNLTSTEDLAFLHQVINEPPCRNLASCSGDEKGSVSPADRHHEGTGETTLAYPQLVALRSLEALLNAPGRPPELSAKALEELEAARRSPVQKVAAMAEQISQQYRSTHP